MLTIRRAGERGLADYGWLRSRHTFSFANYFDPRHMGFRALRVINEDRVDPGAGFPTHPHRDMEIISYVLGGALEHADSMGTGSVIRPGDVQRMSAGTGVTHSEYNASPVEPVHFLQIWLLPEARGLAPSYAQRHFPESERTDTLRLLASRDGRDGSISIHQDADLYGSLLSPDATLRHRLAPGRHAWVQVARGSVSLNGESLGAGDGAAISDIEDLELTGNADSEVLLFDLA